MAPSTIAVQYKDNSIRQVFCRDDGYIGSVGIILLKKYFERNKVEALIDNGDIKTLNHSIDNTIFYRLNLNEPLYLNKPAHFNSVESYTYLIRRSYKHIKYNYIYFSDDLWYIYKLGKGYTKLDSIF